MLSFITYRKAPEELEIVADNKGIDDLIQFLQSVQKGKDHMHLIMDSEIVNFPIPKKRKGEVILVRQVRLEFGETDLWTKSKNST